LTVNTASAILTPGEGQALMVLGDRVVCKAVGNAPAEFLAWVSPAGLEHFFAEIDQTLKTVPVDLETISAIAARHNIQPAC